MTPDGWVHGNEIIGNNSFFKAQSIDCRYPISGTYGPTPRYIFYTLIILSIFWRKNTWIATAAVGTVMAYSATAAIHALVLFIPNLLERGSHADVLVEGKTMSSAPDTEDNTIWVRLFASVLDSDSEAVWTIVTTTCLVLFPIRLWSSTLQGRQYTLLVSLWAMTMFVGLMAAIAFFVITPSFLTSGSEMRFCPVDRNDTLPLTIQDPTDPYQYSVGFDREDIYGWNRTIADYFVHRNLSFHPPNAYIYPCLSSFPRLRDLSEAHVTPSLSEHRVGKKKYTWIIVLPAMASTLTTVLLLSGPDSSIFFVKFHIKIFGFKKHFGTVPTDEYSHRVFVILAIAFLYTVLVSPIAILGNVIYMERWLWITNSEAEGFHHIGQWGTLVTAALVLTAAFCSHIAPWVKPKISRRSLTYYELTELPVSEESQGPRQWWRH